jgi:hypothetical protein
MRLFEHDLLELWAGGEPQHPLDRAIGALAMASGDRRATVADLAIGERDVRLFELYRALAGPWIKATARCPACGELAELSITVDDLSPRRDEARTGEVTVTHGGFVVRCRQPSSPRDRRFRRPRRTLFMIRLVGRGAARVRKVTVKYSTGVP